MHSLFGQKLQLQNNKVERTHGVGNKRKSKKKKKKKKKKKGNSCQVCKFQRLAKDSFRN